MSSTAVTLQANNLTKLANFCKIEGVKNLKEVIDWAVDSVVDDLNLEFQEKDTIKESDVTYFEESSKRLEQTLAADVPNDRVEILVSSVRYQTTLSTLRNAPKNSLLYTMFNDNTWRERYKDGIVKIDRPNGKLFGYILDQLRSGSVHVPEPDKPVRLALQQEYKFFGVPLVEAKDSDTDKLVRFSFDPTKKHTSLTLSNNNKTVTHNGPTGHATVVGTKVFKSGVHKWKIRVDGPAYWVVFGVCLKNQVTTQLVSDYSHAWCTGSNSYKNKMDGNIPYLRQGDEFLVTLNLDVGTIVVTGPQNTNMSASSLPKGEYVPFANLYSATCSLTISK